MTMRLDTTRRLRRFVRREQGTQLVELAIVLPILMLLFGATAEFGRFFYTYTTLAKATRAGARYVVNKPVGANDTAAKNLVVYGNTAGTGTPVLSGLTASNVSITPNEVVSGAPKTITVKIQNYTYTPMLDLGKLAGKTFSLKVNVSPSSTMRFLLTQPS